MLEILFNLNLFEVLLTHTEEAQILKPFLVDIACRIKNGWIKTSEEAPNGPTMEEAVRSFEVAMLITATKGKIFFFFCLVQKAFVVLFVYNSFG
ncbi:hypothetical protein ACJIZ3_023473 [Penstemon smallii]|uniref:Uncharacterized protein n=1 Tax=Penstemon smallii TaxID=265156 RepID=A0ABD3TRI7_9LAMI